MRKLLARTNRAWLLTVGVLLLATTACAPWPGNGIDTRPAEEVLLNGATRVIDQQRCDVARLVDKMPIPTAH